MRNVWQEKTNFNGEENMKEELEKSLAKIEKKIQFELEEVQQLAKNLSASATNADSIVFFAYSGRLAAAEVRLANLAGSRDAIKNVLSTLDKQ